MVPIAPSITSIRFSSSISILLFIFQISFNGTLIFRVHVSMFLWLLILLYLSQSSVACPTPLYYSYNDYIALFLFYTSLQASGIRLLLLARIHSLRVNNFAAFLLFYPLRQHN